uniref:Cytochrome c biogenesis protein CcsA n=1 Tax=Dipteris conjugata TaxID=32108 RepID=A0A0B5EEJ1_9MONI|nr:cytochrome c heme attachment protein [Dipteris conjugata]
MIHTDIEHIFAHISFLTLLSVTLFHRMGLARKLKRLISLSVGGMTIAFICITGFTTIRRIQPKHLPPSNLHESSMFLSRSFSPMHVIMRIRSRNEWSGAVTAPGAMSTHGFATLGLPEEMQQSTPLVPALQPHRLMTHVSMMPLSHVTSLCGSPSATSPPIATYDAEQFSIPGPNQEFPTWTPSPGVDIHCYEQAGSNPRNSFHRLSLNSRRCRLIHQLDRWSYRLISLGFPLLTVGILSGAVWANEAWGSYWSRDPKETWALVTRLIYAIHLHTRITSGWQGEGPAIVASTGFFIAWICFSGVNPPGIGLHNHGWLT